ncbi:MAG TPA: GNAT family N-acetyltransferase [Verrucomicrobiae bacterium]|nr:GNAT family N-acetyltransferase [Verrucomicrobiae bacterium]
MKTEVSQKPATPNFPVGKIIALRDGAYLLRPLCAEDEPRLREFFYSHSQETIQLRYGYMIGTMTHKRASRLVNVDQQKDVALGIFEIKGAEQTLHAVGRYYSEADGQTAEIAFVVREIKRRRGMAAALLHQLAAIAATHSLIFFHAQVQHDNQAMRQLLDRYHARTNRIPDSDLMIYQLPVARILKSRIKA